MPAIPFLWAGGAALVSFVGGYFSGSSVGLFKWLLIAIGGYVLYQKVMG